MPKKSKSENPSTSGFQLTKPLERETSPDLITGESAISDAEDSLPHSYGVDTIFLIAQDPHWLFTYWDIDIAKHPGGPTFLRCCRDGGEVEQEIEVPFETRNWYIPTTHSGSGYFVEIGYHRAGNWNQIARSETVTTPPEDLSANEDFDFATVPLHLSFQRLADNLQTVLKSGENLMQAVSRMQKSGDFSAFGGALPPVMTPEHRNLLSSLLGRELVDQLCSRAMDSQELHSRVMARIEELLTSSGSSEAMHVLEALSPYSGAGSFASEFAVRAGQGGLSSWSPGETAGWAAGWITSWAQAATTSWVAAGNSSWGGSSSENFGGESFGVSLASLTSWLTAVQSSWAQAATTSWREAGASSWLAGAGSSGWSGSSGVDSSEFHSDVDRGFFMHVNAEVIFYGGTDPKASLTIDGKPVALAPDGTFRYHHVFPNAEYEVPVVAVSPDGKETRKATLHFRRNSEKVGVVTDTAQPAIAEPVGRVG